MCRAVLVGDGRCALSEEGTRRLYEGCAHVDGLAPPHVVPGHSEVTGPPPPPVGFLLLPLPLPLPPRAPAEWPVLEVARGAPPNAEDESRFLPPLLLLLLPALALAG